MQDSQRQSLGPEALIELAVAVDERRIVRVMRLQALELLLVRNGESGIFLAYLSANCCAIDLILNVFKK